jgi:hypothetical protein
VWPAKNSGGTRLVVISQAVALAPFSQYSNRLGLAGFSQAQLTQEKPSCLFCFSSRALPAASRFS